MGHQPTQPRQVERLQIEVVVDEEITLPTAPERLAQSAREACRYRDCDQGELAIRVTDDPTIHEVNRSHLHHDYPTDVISFGYHLEPPHVEGELIVSVDTARRIAAEQGWAAEHELMLYVVHGTLHICGMEDGESEPRQAMRKAEVAVMLRLGIAEIERFGVDGQTVGGNVTPSTETLQNETLQNETLQNETLQNEELE